MGPPNASAEKTPGAPAAALDPVAERVVRSRDAGASVLEAAATARPSASRGQDPAAALRLRIALGESEAPPSPARTGLVLSDNCLEPYRATSSVYEGVHQSMGFPPLNALAVMVFTPVFGEEPRVLALHRRETGEFFASVVRMTASPEQRTRYERELDATTGRVFERLWSALLAGTRVDDGNWDLGCCVGPGCISFELMQGRQLGVSALVRRPGSIIDLATDAASVLARMIEQPAPGDETDVALLRQKMQLALDRVLRNTSCWMPAGTSRAGASP